MTKVLVKTRRVGESIAGSILKEATEQEGTREGELEVRKVKREWFGATKRVGAFTKKVELDSHD